MRGGSILANAAEAGISTRRSNFEMPATTVRAELRQALSFIASTGPGVDVRK
jgi:hypothetical protein